MGTAQTVLPSRDLVQILCDNLELACEDYVQSHKSRHWDVFGSDYFNRISDLNQWPDFRNNGLTAGLDIGFQKLSANRESTEIVDIRKYRHIVARYRSLKSITGGDFIRRYHEADIGRPEYVSHDGLKLNVTDLRHLHDAWRISTLRPKGFRAQVDRCPVIMEIGGGFGGLAAKLKRLFPQAFVILLDLPEVNALQTYYLGQAFPKARAAYYEDFKTNSFEGLMSAGYDFAVLPGWIINRIPAQSVDLAVNTRSMMEMNKTTVDTYMAAINRLVRVGGMFYCVNRYVKTTVGEPIKIKDYAYDDHWFSTVSGPAWDQPWLHELALVRTDHPNSRPPSRLLAELPPYSWSDFFGHLARAGRVFKDLTWGGHHNVNPGVRGSLFLWRRVLERAAVRVVRRSTFLHRVTRRLLGRR